MISETKYNPHQDEDTVIGMLRECFPNRLIRPSTGLEQRLDIDVWVGQEGVSIKSQSLALRTGKLVFELEVYQGEGQWKKSHFYTSQADWYAILVGKVLYCIDCVTLWSASKSGSDFPEYRTLSLDTKQKQEDIKHRHKDALLGLWSLDDLLNKHIARTIYAMEC